MQIDLNIDNLPQELLDKLPKNRTKVVEGAVGEILLLLSKAPTGLSHREVMIAYYNMYKEILEAQFVRSNLSYLKTKGKAVSIKSDKDGVVRYFATVKEIDFDGKNFFLEAAPKDANVLKDFLSTHNLTIKEAAEISQVSLSTFDRYLCKKNNLTINPASWQLLQLKVLLVKFGFKIINKE